MFKQIMRIRIRLRKAASRQRRHLLAIGGGDGLAVAAHLDGRHLLPRLQRAHYAVAAQVPHPAARHPSTPSVDSCAVLETQCMLCSRPTQSATGPESHSSTSSVDSCADFRHSECCAAPNGPLQAAAALCWGARSEKCTDGSVLIASSSMGHSVDAHRELLNRPSEERGLLLLPLVNSS